MARPGRRAISGTSWVEAIVVALGMLGPTAQGSAQGPLPRELQDLLAGTVKAERGEAGRIRGEADAVAAPRLVPDLYAAAQQAEREAEAAVQRGDLVLAMLLFRQAQREFGWAADAAQAYPAVVARRIDHLGPGGGTPLPLRFGRTRDERGRTQAPYEVFVVARRRAAYRIRDRQPSFSTTHPPSELVLVQFTLASAQIDERRLPVNVGYPWRHVESTGGVPESPFRHAQRDEDLAVPRGQDVAFDVLDSTSAGEARLTPRSPLVPGEYAFLHPQTKAVWEFAIGE